MKCGQCANEVSTHLRECLSCGDDCGFPNVRLVNREEEKVALDKRVNAAVVSAKARGCEAALNSFGEAVKASKAVICRSLSDVSSIVTNASASYTSFQRQVQSGSKVPQDNEFDNVRIGYEEALYPHFSNNIIFGSLSLYNSGISGYGSVTMVLKDALISKRASVFEENPHTFVKKHRIILNEPLPCGYRADWENRYRLAMAKLHSNLSSTSKTEDFAAILQNDTGGTGTSDFIEVHIYGTINRNAIEKAVMIRPKTKMDRLLWKALTCRLEDIGAEAELI